MSRTTSRRIPTTWVALGIVAVALLLAGVVSYYASSSPDGLNRVAQDKGFSGTAKNHPADRPFAGYATKDVDDQRLSGGLAGVVGVVVVLALAGGVTQVVRRRRPDSPSETEGAVDRDHEPSV